MSILVDGLTIDGSVCVPGAIIFLRNSSRRAHSVLGRRNRSELADRAVEKAILIGRTRKSFLRAQPGIACLLKAA
jgi:hypothetical protein